MRYRSFGGEICGGVALGVFLARTLPPGAPAAAGPIILNPENPFDIPTSQPQPTTSYAGTSGLLIRNNSGATGSAGMSGRPDTVFFRDREAFRGKAADGQWQAFVNKT